jgi:hypothetical protein
MPDGAHVDMRLGALEFLLTHLSFRPPWIDWIARVTALTTKRLQKEPSNEINDPVSIAGSEPNASIRTGAQSFIARRSATTPNYSRETGDCAPPKYAFN